MISMAKTKAKKKLFDIFFRCCCCGIGNLQLPNRVYQFSQLQCVLLLPVVKMRSVCVYERELGRSPICVCKSVFVCARCMFAIILINKRKRMPFESDGIITLVTVLVMFACSSYFLANTHAHTHISLICIIYLHVFLIQLVHFFSPLILTKCEIKYVQRARE